MIIQFATIVITHGQAAVLANLLTSRHATLSTQEADTIRDMLMQYNEQEITMAREDADNA